MKVAWLFGVVLLGGGLLALAQGALADRGKDLFSLCSSCHGLKGEGNPSPKIAAPAIAGLPEWYISEQLKKFRQGGRGQHPQDLAGNRMRPMAKTLKDNGKSDDLPLVAAYVASLVPPARPTSVGFPKANPEKGKVLYAVCAACHGANAEGIQALNAPGLTRFDDHYLLLQLKNFKNGIRGADPRKDPKGAGMVPMAKSLVDEQAMQDVIAYIKTLP